MRRENIERVIDKIGIPLRFVGYEYLIESVILFSNNRLIENEEIYLKIAKKHNTTRGAVERGIRYLIEKYGDKIKEKLNIDYKLTNKSFIRAIEKKARR